MKNAVLLLTLGLAACGPSNRSLDTQKAPVVSFTDMAYDLKPSGERIDGPQLHAFSSYLRAIGAGYGDHVSIFGATMAQRATIAAIVGTYGAATEQGGLSAEPGLIHIVIRHSSVTVPNCPDWRRLSNPEVDGSTMSNYGCASRSNLAAMVADPFDLIEGKGFQGTDAFVNAKAIKAYREKAARDEKMIRSLDLATSGTNAN